MGRLANPWTIEKTPNGCHIFHGVMRTAYYGEIVIAGKRTLAHRFFYEKEHGPIPEGYVIHHKCGNTLCVNLEHLELTTEHAHHHLHPSDAAKHNAGKTHCDAGHEFSEENTYTDPRGWRQCKTCRCQYKKDFRKRKRGELNGTRH